MKIPSDKELGFKITDKLWEMVLAYYKDCNGGVVPDSYIEAFSKDRLQSIKRQVDRLKSLGVAKKSICLDAGCGTGGFITLANLAGYNYCGYDIDEKALEITKELFKVNKIPLKKIGLSPDDKSFGGIKFDFISSFQVVEHVENMKLYFKKLKEVIKKDGSFFIETPNYIIPYEPHYYVFMLPGPKSLKWLSCKLTGRTNKKYFDELNMVTPRSLEGALRENGFEWTNLGRKEWADQLLADNLEGRNSYVKAAANFIKSVIPVLLAP